MSDKVLVDVDNLRQMLCRIQHLDVLEANGVDNWSGFGEDESGMMDREEYEDYLHTLTPEQLARLV